MTRRGFLQTGDRGGARRRFRAAAAARRARALAADTAVFAPNAWLRITPDGRITVVSGSAEMGQGVLTAIPMLLAEELDADWGRVVVEQAPVDKAYANPMFGMQATGGSTTVRAHWEPLRKAGAAAREMLVAAAAAQWQLDAATLRTEKSRVIAADGRSVDYGALVATASQRPVPTDPKLKDPKDFKLLGRPLKRLDTPAKVDGSAIYGIDASVPGMLVAVMARAPMPGDKPAQVDDTQGQGGQGRAPGDHDPERASRCSPTATGPRRRAATRSTSSGTRASTPTCRRRR